MTATEKLRCLERSASVAESIFSALFNVEKFFIFFMHACSRSSPRVLAHLERLGRYPSPSMAVTTIVNGLQGISLGHPEPALPSPPAVAITPCDPWPRPYYLESGLRRVVPYHYTYNIYCKQRWRRREILDIFTTEFRDRSRDYYKDAIKTGQITINGKLYRDIYTAIKNGDVISHTVMNRSVTNVRRGYQLGLEGGTGL